MNEELKIKISVDSGTASKNINNVTDDLEDFGEEAKDTSKKSDSAFSDIGKAAKTGFAAASAAIAAAGVALAGIAESTRDYRTAQGKLTTAFKTAGSNAETATKVYKELNGVLGDSDVAVEAANHLAKLTTNEQDLEKWTNICTGVFATFGDSLPIEGLTEAANETAKTGELTGSLADALNWAGVAEDEFQRSLDLCTTEQERQALITDTLNGLYSEAASTYKTTNAEVIAANKATEDWNAQMAKMGGYIEPAITGFKQLGVSVLEGLEEPVKDVSKFLTDSFIPAIKSVGTWISENKEIILAAGAAIVGGLVAYKAATVASTLATEGLQAAQTLLNAIMNANPYVLLATVLAAATAAMIAYAASVGDAKDRVDPLTESERALVEKIDEETTAIKDRKTAYEESAGANVAHMEHIKELAQELGGLADASGRVQEADQVRAQFILNELNEALGTEYSMVDGVITKYNDLKNTITEVVEAKTANSMLEAKNAEYVAAIEAEDEALLQVVLTQKDYEAQVGNVTKAEKDLMIARSEAVEYFERGTEASISTGNAMVTSALNNYNKEVDILKNKKSKYEEASGNYATHYQNIEDYTNAAMLIQQGEYNAAIDILKNKSNAYFEYADNVDSATRKAIDALYKEAVDTGIEAKRIKQNFENGVDGYTEDMVKESEQAHTDAMNAWVDAYNEANGIGKDIGDGLGNGMNSKKSTLVAKAKSLIDSIWASMKQAADSHSPSRKTMALGGDIGKGLEIGIDKSTYNTEKAAKNLVEKSIAPVQASVTGITWNNLDKAFSTTLTPVGDINIKNDTVIGLKNEESTQDIILKVDGKILAQTSIDSINQLTKQTGSLPLVLA